MKRLFYCSCIIFSWIACVPVNQNTSSGEINKALRTSDWVYEDDIRTVQLHPFQGNIEDQIKPAVLAIDQNIPLLLSFDQLYTEYEDFRAKIIHCNYNWEKSLLSDNEFLYDFNEFPLRDYEVSFNTRTGYTHYRFTVPRVKLPGNYLVVVYRGSNPDDLILTKRFMVYTSQVGISPEMEVSSDINKRRSNQQVNFSINYSNLEILDPLNDIKIVIRQNKRWDNALTFLKPTFLRENEQILEYEHFNSENNFRGGNEFRFFDLRTINYTGQNISGIEKKPNRVDAFVFKDRNRGDEVYGQFNDINGDYLINNLETSPPQTTSDYINVHFFLELDKIPDDIYIAGELTNWEFTRNNLLQYDEEMKGYRGSLLLKQGWYNYIYYVPESAANPYLLEGSFFETENTYEFFVYFRPRGTRADQLVGYYQLNYNNRR